MTEWGAVKIFQKLHDVRGRVNLFEALALLLFSAAASFPFPLLDCRQALRLDKSIVLIFPS